MSRILDFDPLTGMTMTFRYDADTDTTVVGYQQDCAPILDDNKEAALDVDSHRKQAKNEWAHYARIPTVVQYKWLYEHGVNFADKNHWPKVMQLLNSPEYKYLKRTTYYHDR